MIMNLKINIEKCTFFSKIKSRHSPWSPSFYRRLFLPFLRRSKVIINWLAGFLLKTKTQLRILPLALLVITESLFTTLHKLHIHCSNDLKERCSFLFGPEDCNSRFSKNWKNKLVKCPYLNTFLTIRNHFIIRMDASRIGLRWCFYFQVKDNIEVPIYFWK